VEPSAGGADQEAINMLVAEGMPYSKAVALVRANKQQASAGLQARIDAAAAERAPAPAPVAPEEETVSPETIRQYGYMPQAEPGPSSVRGGGKVTPGQQFTKMSEAIGYMTRTPVTDANRAQAYPDAAYLPSPRDRDMAARGFFPVTADDGSVSYSVGTGREAMGPQDEGRGIPGGLGRLGPRRDLQETDPSQPGFTLEPVRGPTGTNYIYKQNEAAQDQQAAYMKERQLYRMAKAAGMSPSEFAAQNEGAFGAIDDNPMAKARMMVQGVRQEAEADRLAKWKSQMMLAGSNPARNASNAFSMLSPEDQQKIIMARFTNGRSMEPEDPRIKAATIAAAAETEKARLAREADNQSRADALTAAERQHAERLTAMTNQHNESMGQQKVSAEATLAKYAAESEASKASSAERMVGLQAQLETLKQQGVTQQGQLSLNEQKFKEADEERKQLRAASLHAKREAEAGAQWGPGGVHIVRGRMDTPEAQQAFKNMAAKADQTWNGFFTDDAKRLDELIVSLGIQDPATRRALVQKYGIDSDIPGQAGRGALSSAWRVSHPGYDIIPPGP
jgi:hypothetical protein